MLDYKNFGPKILIHKNINAKIFGFLWKLIPYVICESHKV